MAGIAFSLAFVWQQPPVFKQSPDPQSQIFLGLGASRWTGLPPANVRHPFIATLRWAWQTEDRAFLVMDYPPVPVSLQ